MDAVVLRAGAAVMSALTFLGATLFTLDHPKNPAAPLQPPVAEDVPLTSKATPTASVAPVATLRPGATPRTQRGTPPPQITLAPGVRATSLPGITFTHVS